MKAFLKLLILIFIASAIEGCFPTHTTYKAKILNESSSEITDIQLGMIGVEEGVSIDSLPMGESTEYYEFLLKKTKEGEPIPISYGDYSGSYTQIGEGKSIVIPTPTTEISIKINDESFSIE